MSPNESIKLLAHEEVLLTFKKGGIMIILPFFFGVSFLFGIIESLWKFGIGDFYPLLFWVILFTLCVYSIIVIGKSIGYVTNMRVIFRDGFDNIQSINIDSIESISSSGLGSKVKITGKSGSSIVLSGIDGVQEIERLVREQQAKKL